MTTFRVHFDDGEKIDVQAASSAAAGKIAVGDRKDIRVKKIKKVRE